MEEGVTGNKKEVQGSRSQKSADQEREHRFKLL